MSRRSTRHVVIGGLAIAYGAVLGLFWGSVVQGVAGIRDRLPPLVWVVLAALAVVPVLLVVTGSRLCRVVARPSQGLRGLIALAMVVLLVKALLVGLLALSAAGGSSGSYYRGGGVIGGALAVLVVVPSVVAAFLLACGTGAAAPRSAEARDYDDALFTDRPGPRDVSAGRRWALAAAAVLAPLGLLGWYALASGRAPGVVRLGLLFGPYLVLGLASLRPWVRRTGWWVLALAVLVLAVWQSPLTVWARTGFSLPFTTGALVPWFVAGLGVLVAWIASPVGAGATSQVGSAVGTPGSEP